MLDGAVQLSEVDEVYSRSLLADSVYHQADVLILGGGDGALLAELLHHHQPRQVTMVELDGAVMRAVRDHMHSVTGGVLDCHTTERYNIITGDALKHLSDCQRENKKYDFIFGDLTDVPIDTDNHCQYLLLLIAVVLRLSHFTVTRCRYSTWCGEFHIKQNWAPSAFAFHPTRFYRQKLR